MNLDHADVELDFYTDVPPRSFVPEVAQIGADASLRGAREQELDELAGALYGPAYYYATINGRSAERALVAGLALAGGAVLTHGLFHTTQRAFVDGGLTVEHMAIAEEGRADLDLKALQSRLAAGGVAAVCLEPSNNALYGWRLSLENAQAVASLCRNHGALFLLDNARLMSNFLDDEGLDRDAVHALCALADAYTVPCAKELLVPNGGLVAVRDLDVLRRTFAYSFARGTRFEPIAGHAMLAAGIVRMTHDPELLRDRRRQLGLLAEGLLAVGLSIVQPLGGHAVYLKLPPDLGQGGALGFRALEALLYGMSGMRALIKPDERFGCPLLRIPISLGRYKDEQLARLPAALASFVENSAEAPALTPRAGAKNLHPYLSAYDRQDSR